MFAAVGPSLISRVGKSLFNHNTVILHTAFWLFICKSQGYTLSIQKQVVNIRAREIVGFAGSGPIFESEN